MDLSLLSNRFFEHHHDDKVKAVNYMARVLNTHISDDHGADFLIFLEQLSPFQLAALENLMTSYKGTSPFSLFLLSLYFAPCPVRHSSKRESFGRRTGDRRGVAIRGSPGRVRP
jgi:hypothetical protein